MPNPRPSFEDQVTEYLAANKVRVEAGIALPAPNTLAGDLDIYLQTRQVVPSVEAMTAPGPNHPATKALQVKAQLP